MSFFISGIQINFAFRVENTNINEIISLLTASVKTAKEKLKSADADNENA